MTHKTNFISIIKYPKSKIPITFSYIINSITISINLTYTQFLLITIPLHTILTYLKKSLKSHITNIFFFHT